MYTSFLIKGQLTFEEKEWVKEVESHGSFVYTAIQLYITFKIRDWTCTKTKKPWFLLVHWATKTVKWIKKSCVIELD